MAIDKNLFGKVYATWKKLNNEWIFIGWTELEEKGWQNITETEDFIHVTGANEEYKFRKKGAKTKPYPEEIYYEVVTKQGTVLFSKKSKEEAIKFVNDSEDDLMVICVRNQIIYEK